ncbi:Zinc carboxypeptidase [Amycolatopsis arida]|uniref:Zinc carboxypeptidase n=1 Tax=Amycolatopsis arida TaxID=587909 RepID=A0A1I5UPK7_9PSEU|nr:M14 family zinc carboxypeptidase [Amycolatopsis arida]TDX90983.1 zinc carboxypeptidase [Amycolatopsis arida]SFP97150.1 Zinc carboxypeptidase [Amycolatopsis arida]
MPRARSARRLLAAAALLLLPATALPAQAAPPTGPDPGATTHREPGNGPERNRVAATDAAPRPVAARAAGENRRHGDHRGYPRRTELRVYPEDPTDKAVKLGLVPYHALAPRLNDLQARSDRVSVEVIGQSTLGRDLYLVTVTAPERPAETRRQDRWRELIENDPARAARNVALVRHYKAPIWINANIHGDEWEGTDGALRVIERLATAQDRDTRRLLERTRIHVTVTNNPDGRVAGTRANAAGFDINRDHITSAQPESRAVRDVVIGTQPLVMLDEHGYTGTTLIEPATPPHGQNYEYDLYIKHAYANALGMEKAVAGLGHPETATADIPFRDFDPGEWDDWPPIFTPMYAIYHGAVGHTVEVPLRVNRREYDTLPVEELRRRSAINTDVAAATIRAAIDYTDHNRAALIADQIEQFRRGWAGTPQRQVPDGYVPGYGPEDRYTVDFPRAYVIPAGEGQRSAPAAARLVDHLVVNDVRVGQARSPFRLGGRAYPAGSYLVDMHQPKRGLANAILAEGKDISADVPRMYDISGWSHRLLWGASVDVVRDEAPRVRTTPVTAAAPTGGVDAAPGQDLALALLDGKDVQAVNTLLGQGLPVHRQTDGGVMVPASARSAALAVAERFGVRFTAAPAGERGPLLRRPVLAAAVGADELAVLRELGFEVHPVSTSALNSGFDLSRVDTLVVSSGLSYRQLTAQARAAVDAFLARGGVVTRGATGAAFNADAGLLRVRAVAGRDDANGVVATTTGGGAVGSGSPAHSFVYSPIWFTELGESVVAEQRYATGNPLVAGHWLPGKDGQGPAQAAGSAAVVSGTADRGTRTVLFGTEPLFRAHPKGLFAQFARAVYWTSTP